MKRRHGESLRDDKDIEIFTSPYDALSSENTQENDNPNARTTRALEENFFRDIGFIISREMEDVNEENEVIANRLTEWEKNLTNMCNSFENCSENLDHIENPSTKSHEYFLKTMHRCYKKQHLRPQCDSILATLADNGVRITMPKEKKGTNLKINDDRKADSLQFNTGSNKPTPNVNVRSEVLEPSRSETVDSNPLIQQNFLPKTFPLSTDHSIFASNGPTLVDKSKDQETPRPAFKLESIFPEPGDTKPTYNNVDSKLEKPCGTGEKKQSIFIEPSGSTDTQTSCFSFGNPPQVKQASSGSSLLSSTKQIANPFTNPFSFAPKPASVSADVPSKDPFKSPTTDTEKFPSKFTFSLPSNLPKEEKESAKSDDTIEKGGIELKTLPTNPFGATRSPQAKATFPSGVFGQEEKTGGNDTFSFSFESERKKAPLDTNPFQVKTSTESVLPAKPSIFTFPGVERDENLKNTEPCSLLSGEPSTDSVSTSFFDASEKKTHSTIENPFAPKNEVVSIDIKDATSHLSTYATQPAKAAEKKDPFSLASSASSQTNKVSTAETTVKDGSSSEAWSLFALPKSKRDSSSAENTISASTGESPPKRSKAMSRTFESNEPSTTFPGGNFFEAKLSVEQKSIEDTPTPFLFSATQPSSAFGMNPFSLSQPKQENTFSSFSQAPLSKAQENEPAQNSFLLPTANPSNELIKNTTSSPEAATPQSDGKSLGSNPFLTGFKNHGFSLFPSSSTKDASQTSPEG